MDIKRWFKFENDADYVRLAWFAFTLPLLISIVGFITIAYSEQRYPIVDFCGTQSCWSNFVETFKVPLSTAGISILLGTMALTLRRAFQGAKQIERFDAQEKLTIHLKNKEIFISEFDRTFDSLTHEIECGRHRLYDYFYPIESRSGLDKEKVKSTLGVLSTCVEEIHAIISDLEHSSEFPYFDESHFNQVHRELRQLEAATTLKFNSAFTRGEFLEMGTANHNIRSLSSMDQLLSIVNDIIEFTALFGPDEYWKESLALSFSDARTNLKSLRRYLIDIRHHFQLVDEIYVEIWNVYANRNELNQPEFDSALEKLLNRERYHVLQPLWTLKTLAFLHKERHSVIDSQFYGLIQEATSSHASEQS